MISLFTWNDTFLTHLSTVDAQHQRLVALINELGEVVVSTEVLDAESFVAIRTAILDYIRYHFTDEESLMREVGLDSRNIQLHLAEHKKFIDEVLTFVTVDEALTSQQARNLTEYLVRWLAYHILDIDQSMARQIHAIRAGKSAAEAFEMEEKCGGYRENPLLEAMSRLFYVVSERNHELRLLNNELESRVRQRTAELENANRQLQLLSMQDELTGLPNRRFSLMSMTQLWSEKKRYGAKLSVLMIDADHFKQVNDNFGHAQGDALLRDLAKTLRNSVRASDIVCRLGGDEFLVICSNTEYAGAKELAQKILAASRPFCTPEGVECWDGSLSIGAAEADETMTQPEDLLRIADQEMYSVKRRNREPEPLTGQ